MYQRIGTLQQKPRRITGRCVGVVPPYAPGMSRIKVAVTIDATPRQVWRDVADISSHVEWMADAEAIRFLTRKRRGVGTSFDCDTRVGPFRLTDRMTVTSWQTNREMGIRHEGLVTGEGRFTLTPRKGGRTRFVWKERLVFPWWMGGPLGAFAAKPVLRAIWKRNLRRLAARFEG